MTQPRNKRAARGGEGRRRAAGATCRAFAAFRRPPPPCAALVAASIPIANRNLPQPAKSRGSPVALSKRANQYTAPLTPGVVSVHKARRARRETPRAGGKIGRASCRERG